MNLPMHHPVGLMLLTLCIIPSHVPIALCVPSAVVIGSRQLRSDQAVTSATAAPLLYQALYLLNTTVGGFAAARGETQYRLCDWLHKEHIQGMWPMRCHSRPPHTDAPGMTQ